MADDKANKQIKLSEPEHLNGQISHAAMELIRKAKQNKYNGINWCEASTEESIEANALDVVSLHIVSCESDLIEARRSFKPKLAHQIFGQKEKMYGYLYPKIQLYILANSAKCFVKFTHNGMSNCQADTINAKVFDNLICWLPEDYFSDEKRFLQAIQNENHMKMYGKMISECEIYNYNENNRTKFIIRECAVDEPGFAKFHARFQCLIVWYIDAASQLDLEDTNWMYIYVYEEVKVPHKKEIRYYPVGYCAVYKFFHYPDKIRARISQCFILPCCQRMGIGYKLLTATYQAISTLINVVDITVEDPCPAFQRLRDTVDSTLLRKLECFKYPSIINGFTKKMFDNANCRYKINKRQCHRVYHILRMSYALLSDNKEESETLLKDIQAFLGIPQQNVATKTSFEKEVCNGIKEIKIPSVVEKYANEIRPIAWRVSKLLKEDTM